MKKKFVWFVMFWLLVSVHCGLAETRQGVIVLEGMEEAIEETQFESSQGFSFWYASEHLKADDGDIDGLACVVVSALYSDDCMTQKS